MLLQLSAVRGVINVLASYVNRSLVCLPLLQKVVPFNVVAWLKSPMGMMAGFMVFAIAIMPYLKVCSQASRCLPLASLHHAQCFAGQTTAVLPCET
jgi:hypothetical protein